MSRRHTSAAEDVSASEEVPVDVAHETAPVANDEVGDGTAETEGGKREIKIFTADEAYRRIANILKRTPKEKRTEVLAAATAVAALG
jgi:hypothetical protein